MSPSSLTPAECDVLVCGGGSAGVATAVSAARHGAQVILVERWPVVGGMATAALVTCFHRSDREKLVIRGLVQETVERLGREGWIVEHVQEPHVHETEWFDPEGMKVVWHRMLDEAKVRTFCYLPVAEALVESGRARGGFVETKLGRRTVRAAIVVDATGDGDIAAKAGLPFAFGREGDGRVQGMTMMYQIAGIDEARRRAISPEERRAIRREMIGLRDAGKLPPFNAGADLCAFDNMGIPNMSPAAGNPLDEEELTRLTVRARAQVHEYVRFARRRIPGFEKCFIVQTGFSLGIRESRRIRGLKTLDAAGVLGAVKQPDAVGHGVWMIDIHDPLGTGWTTWNDRQARGMLPQGQSYHIPLGMCLNDRIPNLAVVGRCASSTHEAHASVRVMSHLMAMGQGLGVAAAVALEQGCDLAAVDVRRVQQMLKEDGVYLEDVPGT